MKIGQAICKWCGYKTTTGGIIEHNKTCPKNPKNMTQKITPEATPDLYKNALQEIIHTTASSAYTPFQIVSRCFEVAAAALDQSNSATPASIKSNEAIEFADVLYVIEKIENEKRVSRMAPDDDYKDGFLKALTNVTAILDEYIVKKYKLFTSQSKNKSNE